MRRHLIHAEKTLLRHTARVLAMAAVIMVCAAPLTVTQAADSPSVRAAARLKNHPPRGWIRHYLGEDRYKIAGGTWRFVSTELDRFYYPAYAPEMLRQSPNRVIGFASAKDAEEAGYLPGAGYAGIDPVFDREYAGAGSSSSSSSSSRTTVNRTAKPIRITLSDGSSTVMLPPNWRRTAAGARSTVAGQASISDVLQPLNRGGSITFSFVNAPISVEPFLNARAFPQLVQLATQRGGAQASAALSGMSVSDAKVGGLSGVRVTSRGGASAMFKGRTSIGARGSKAYIVQNDSSAAGADKVVASFRAR